MSQAARFCPQEHPVESLGEGQYCCAQCDQQYVQEQTLVALDEHTTRWDIMFSAGMVLTQEQEKLLRTRASQDELGLTLSEESPPQVKLSEESTDPPAYPSSQSEA